MQNVVKLQLKCRSNGWRRNFRTN